jgi:hypothetical protein
MLDGGYHFDTQKAVDKRVSFYENDAGTLPATWCFIHWGMRSDYFPTAVCDAMINRGIIPQIRHYFSPEWNEVSAGKHDEMISGFAIKAKHFGKPFILIPYPEANTSLENLPHPHGGGRGKDFRAAYKHIRGVFKQVGANNAVFGLHLLPYEEHQYMGDFKLDNEDFDWLGFSAYNLERWLDSYPFAWHANLFYGWAKYTYPNKPLALFELGTSDTKSQGRWIRNAYKHIKNHLPRLKLVEYYEVGFGGLPGESSDNTDFNELGSRAYTEALKDSYFVTGPLKFLDKYK